MKIARSDGRAPLPSAIVGEFFYQYGLVGRSRTIEKVIRLVELVSDTRSTVLITGETGTGKELVAPPQSAIRPSNHRHDRRRRRCLIGVG